MPPAPTVSPTVAVVLSGCGVNDGSEIHESVSLLLNLSRHGAAVKCFAPDRPQTDVIDHARGEPAQGESRNCMVEAARIARGDIQPLEKLRAADFDAVFFPGGFGAAKNLCDFATRGADMKVVPEVERVLRDFTDAGKPIGMCCIAPIIAARVIDGATITLGDPSDASRVAESFGATHEPRPVNEICVDETNRLVTAPAYMHGDAPIHRVDEGIGKMVEKTLELASAAATA